MDEKAMGIYRTLMIEVRYRCDAIDDVFSGKTTMRVRIAEEFCYLQLRMICETIALGCLIIHGNISSKHSDLMKAYQADQIMKRLSQLHPKFFPRPLQNDDEISTGVPAWVEKPEGFLTAQDLSQLWSKYGGDRLHRGSLKKILNSKPLPDMNKVIYWKNKIVELLNKHIIYSPDEKKIFYCIMEDGNGNVHSALFDVLESS